MRGGLIFPREVNLPSCTGFDAKRLMGFEPTTFCMAITPAIWRVQYQN
jgi:hypothetical protein